MTEREAYQDTIEAQLREWRAEIENLKAQVIKAKVNAKLEHEKQIDELTHKQASFHSRPGLWRF